MALGKGYIYFLQLSAAEDPHQQSLGTHRITKKNINLSFGLSSSYSEEFAQQTLGFSSEANAQRPFASSKSTRGASKIPALKRPCRLFTLGQVVSGGA